MPEENEEDEEEEMIPESSTFRPTCVEGTGILQCKVVLCRQRDVWVDGMVWGRVSVFRTVWK